MLPQEHLITEQNWGLLGRYVDNLVSQKDYMAWHFLAIQNKNCNWKINKKIREVDALALFLKKSEFVIFSTENLITGLLIRSSHLISVLSHT